MDEPSVHDVQVVNDGAVIRCGKLPDSPEGIGRGRVLRPAMA